MIDKNGDDEVFFLSSIDGNGIKRDEQRASIENTFGGGPILNTGGGGGKWEQCWHALPIAICRESLASIYQERNIEKNDDDEVLVIMMVKQQE